MARPRVERVLRERFSRPLDRAAARLSESTREDLALLPHDLWGSLAHARMLGRTGIIPPASSRRIEAGLRSIARDARAGRFPLDPALEDVHLNVESALTRRIGPDGERLHTARSRNDQVATDLLTYGRDALLALELAALSVARALERAARGPDGRNVVDGWTHLQPAQRVYWAQILGTHALRFVRDAERFAATRRRADRSPLGSGALAGSSLPIDRRLTARLLGFTAPSSTSLDAVSDRDAAAETLFDLALVGVHGSALAEELVLGSMPEVRRVRLSDAFVTSSSLMPHKRNPDLAELARAEASPAVGRLVSHLSLLKGLPAGYQRDLQAGKPLLVEGVERGLGVLEVLRGMVASARFLSPPSAAPHTTGSVELADALVRAGIPFRTAHTRVGRWLSHREVPDGPAGAPTEAELYRTFPELEVTGFRWPSPEEEPERRTSLGGSAWVQVRRLLDEVDRRCATATRDALRERRRLERLRSSLGAYEPGFLGPLRSRPARAAATGRPSKARQRPARRGRLAAASSAPGR
jgi:argininosuccinate lyase